MGKFGKSAVVALAAVVGWIVHAFEPELKATVLGALRRACDPVVGAFVIGIIVGAAIAAAVAWLLRCRVEAIKYDFGTKVRVRTDCRRRRVLSVLGHWCPSSPTCEGALLTKARPNNARISGS
ncbi:MAG: hypothetical protein HMLKMBBP_01675 [Planctomycetes bacterium]|nr:hypothetical protein [Planctomycetota bacterium]